METHLPLGGVAPLALLSDSSWTEQYLRSPWVSFFGNFAPPFPSAEALADDPEKALGKLVQSCLGSSAAMAFLALCAAVVVLLRWCCCCRGCCSAVPRARPTLKPLLCFGCMTLLFTVVGLLTYVTVMREAMDLTLVTAGSVATNVQELSQQAESLHGLGEDVVGLLDTLTNGGKCPQDITDEIDAFDAEARVYNTRASKVASAFKGLHEVVEKAHDTARGGFDKAALAASLLLVILALLCCCSVLAVSLFTHGTGGRGYCSSCCVRSIGICIFVPVVFLLGLSAAVEYAGGMLGASFCANPDTNMISLMGALGDDAASIAQGYDAASIAKYYITAEGKNPLMEADLKMQHDVDEFHQKVGQWISDGVLSDRDSDLRHLHATLGEVLEGLKAVAARVGPATVYPMYKTLVHEAVCEWTISGLGWLALTQLILGAVCLPALTTATDTFLKRWFQQQRQNQAAIEEIRAVEMAQCGA